MVVRPFPAGSSYTPLGVDEDDRLVDFHTAHRPHQGETRPVMFCGIHVLEPTVFDFLPADGFSCINSQAYTRMIADGLNVVAYTDPGPWYDLGSPDRYLQANRDLLSGRVRLPQLEPAGTEAGDGVLMGQRVRLALDAELGPEVAVGDDCRIGARARISRSVLWADSVIEEGASLDMAIVAGARTVQATCPRSAKG
jgi:NDP-sugar pyrophosphorylase family protein